MVCNKFASRPRRPHYVYATFFLHPTSSYYVLTTSLLRPYCVLIPPRPRHVSFEHVQNLIKTSASIKTSLRPYYVPTTSYKTVPRPHYVLIFLGRSKDVVRTWPGVDVTLWHALIFVSNCFNIVTQSKTDIFLMKQSYLCHVCCHGNCWA